MSCQRLHDLAVERERVGAGLLLDREDDGRLAVDAAIAAGTGPPKRTSATWRTVTATGSPCRTTVFSMSSSVIARPTMRISDSSLLREQEAAAGDRVRLLDRLASIRRA